MFRTVHAHSLEILKTTTDIQFVILDFKTLIVSVTTGFFYSDSVEREDTLGDNSVQLQSFVQYEPDLFVSRYVYPAQQYFSFSSFLCSIYILFFLFFCAVTLI